WACRRRSHRRSNAGLSVTLKACQPQLDGQQVCLLFRYKFHQDQVNQPKIKHLLEEILAEVYHRPVMIATKLLADLDIKLEKKQSSTGSTPVTPSDDSAINNLLEIFDGQIVGEA
ncbi:MAG TPA: hypothetical protein PKL05_03385, partial [bacterium]|nr:hypothetical protein [bacterium]